MATVNQVNVGLSGSTGTGNFVGSTSATLVTPALGTPTSGTLTNCTGLPVAGGGTGVASFTAYAVICGGTTSTNPLQSIAGLGSSGYVLTSNGAGALPTFQAAGGGSGTVSSGLQNQLAWYAANGTTVSGLSTANSGVLVTSSGGVPSISSTLPAFTTSSITFNPTTSGIVGTITNNNASAGYVGEYIISTILYANRISLSNNTPADITSISLTAGDWDVSGIAGVDGNVSNITQILNWISTTSATLPDPSLNIGVGDNIAITSFTFFHGAIPTTRYSLSGTTTIYLSAYATFASGVAAASGFIAARRIR